MRSKHRGPPLGKSREQHLGVTLGPKVVTELLQLGAEFKIIVDLAVVREPIAVTTDHRLGGGLAQIYDRQASMSERDLPRCRFRRLNYPVSVKARYASTVWPAVRNLISHRARE